MLDRADVRELTIRRALEPARVADLERPRAAPEREGLGVELGVVEQRSQGAVHVAAEVLVAELEQRDLGSGRGRSIERLHPLPGRGMHGHRSRRRIVGRAGGDDLRPDAHGDRPPIAHDIYEAGARECRAQDLEVAAEGGPLREHPLAAVALAERGQAVAHGGRSGIGVGEQVVPDCPSSPGRGPSHRRHAGSPLSQAWGRTAAAARGSRRLGGEGAPGSSRPAA